MRAAVALAVLLIGCGGDPVNCFTTVCKDNSDCPMGERCNTGMKKCQKLACGPEGTPCADNDFCASGLKCVKGACSPGQAEGELCSDSFMVYLPCRKGLACQPSLEKCAPPSCKPPPFATGERCSPGQCAEGLECYQPGIPGRCYPTGKARPGEACATSAECYPPYTCRSGKCAQNLAEGAYCNTSADCASRMCGFASYPNCSRCTP